ncbi:MAG: Nanos 1 [Marteilia pararefringens]
MLTATEESTKSQNSFCLIDNASCSIHSCQPSHNAIGIDDDILKASISASSIDEDDTSVDFFARPFSSTVGNFIDHGCDNSSSGASNSFQITSDIEEGDRAVDNYGAIRQNQSKLSNSKLTWASNSGPIANNFPTSDCAHSGTTPKAKSPLSALGSSSSFGVPLAHDRKSSPTSRSVDLIGDDHFRIQELIAEIFSATEDDSYSTTSHGSENCIVGSTLLHRDFIKATGSNTMPHSDLLGDPLVNSENLFDKKDYVARESESRSKQVDLDKPSSSSSIVGSKFPSPNADVASRLPLEKIDPKTNESFSAHCLFEKSPWSSKFEDADLSCFISKSQKRSNCCSSAANEHLSSAKSCVSTFISSHSQNHITGSDHNDESDNKLKFEQPIALPPVSQNTIENFATGASKITSDMIFKESHVISPAFALNDSWASQNMANNFESIPSARPASSSMTTMTNPLGTELPLALSNSQVSPSDSPMNETAVWNSFLRLMGDANAKASVYNYNADASSTVKNPNTIVNRDNAPFQVKSKISPSGASQANNPLSDNNSPTRKTSPNKSTDWPRPISRQSHHSIQNIEAELNSSSRPKIAQQRLSSVLNPVLQSTSNSRPHVHGSTSPSPFKAPSTTPEPIISRRQHLTMNQMPIVQQSFCGFCRNNGESEAVYKSHKLKDTFGRVACPVLRSYTCPICACSGDSAHTIKYCPLNSKDEALSKFKVHETPRTSAGKRRLMKLQATAASIANLSIDNGNYSAVSPPHLPSQCVSSSSVSDNADGSNCNKAKGNFTMTR